MKASNASFARADSHDVRGNLEQGVWAEAPEVVISIPWNLLTTRRSPNSPCPKLSEQDAEQKVTNLAASGYHRGVFKSVPTIS